MKYLCESCWNYPCASDKTKKITGCFAYRSKHTNADKLRAMSDEELADWLVMNGNGEDYKTWLDWLRQEAKDD
jgi:hypothetical protein